ncbi:thermonuclease family protein [Oceanotoga sp. DSM 15011]|jgi:micrococcal nuclease|uniref:thermonuclease family protein n=1 Tax=Oceanotoga sp. DSM 15011 TaxID=2984951 RepID=UPI0021F48B4A|nr:thermonuclease family protein [Oceanotoga sp. DSM 15011]UYO99043.1 thermonuclease family protein [Oceanotoga sp. DSM 15011]
MFKKLTLFLLIVTALFLVSCTPKNVNILTPEGYEEFSVTKVVDGDTIKVLEGSNEVSVRFIGVDTPETHDGTKPIGEYGYDAYLFSRIKINGESSRMVYMEFDENRYDYYDRLLGYIYYKDKEDNYHFLNEELLKEGLGRPLFYDDSSKKVDVLREAYIFAFENRNGIFEKYDDPSIIIDSKNLDKKKDLGKNRFVKFFVDKVYKDGSFYKIRSKDGFYVSIREQEFLNFYKQYDIYSLEGKEIMYFGEVWHDGNNFEILGRASFEIKIL